MQAAAVIIGNEVLSGRTQDKNINLLASSLNNIGVALAEVRIIRDDEATIITHINDLRQHYDYVFTSGGIGPTHDDITAESIAKAFKVPLNYNEEAMRLLGDYYQKQEKVFTKPRQRMARIPEGGRLIENTISVAPGFIMENVYVMAGVPAIFAAMVKHIIPELKQGAPIINQSLVVECPESELATPLSEVAQNFKECDIGCYPSWSFGKPIATIVVRGTDEQQVEAATKQIKAFLPTLQSDYQ